MGLQLELHGPARVHPGQTVRYELGLVGDSTHVTGVELVVQASRGYQLSSQVHTHQQAQLARVQFRPAGELRFPVDVVVPPAPTHVLLSPKRLAWAGLWIEARISGRESIERQFPLQVSERLASRDLAPAVVRANQFVELALGLAATRATGGTTLVGQCSIAGHHNEARVAIEVRCTLHTSAGHVLTIPIQSAELRIPSHAAELSVPFTLELPPYLAPSLAIDTHQITYEIRATHKQWRRATSVSLPLHIVDARPAPARIRPPEVGTQPVESLFAELAARAGWRIGPLVDADPELGTMMPWLYTAHAGLVMRLGYAFRDDGSTFLISRIRYQPLEIGFRVVPRRSGGMLSAAIPEWDRVHAADARDHVRATAILTSVVPELAPLGSLVRWDDDWLICERAVTHVDVALLDEVASTLREVARKLASAIHADEREVGPYR